MKLQESGEMYLETILILTEKNQHLRAVDVADKLGYSKPSVSRALSILRNGKYVEVNDDGFLFLTASGLQVAKKIYERHLSISKFLEYIGVDKTVAEEDACRIEHVISDSTFLCIKKFIEKKMKE